MRFFERARLRRGGNFKSQRVDCERVNNGQDRAAAENVNKANQAQGPDTGKRWQHGTTAEIIIAFFTIMLFYIGYRQTGIQAAQSAIQKRQTDISAQQLRLQQASDQSGAVTDAAQLRILEGTSTATVTQAAAMKEMAGAADRQARAADRQVAAAERQAATAAQELALRQISNLDATILGWQYKGRTDVHSPVLWVANHGQYTIRNVRVSVASAYVRGPVIDITRIWARLEPLNPFNSVPGSAGDSLPFKTDELSDTEWDAIINRRAVLLYAAEIVFPDGAGKDQTMRRCIAIYGPPPGEYFAPDCENVK